jgi:hypothetical protein
MGKIFLLSLHTQIKLSGMISIKTYNRMRLIHSKYFESY